MSEVVDHTQPTAPPADQDTTETLRTRRPEPRLARVLSAIGRSLITAGVVVLAFVVFQLWGTNIAEARAQNSLRDDFDTQVLQRQERVSSVTATVPVTVDAGENDEAPDELAAPSTTTTLPGGIDADVLAYFFPEDGEAVARIEIPAIGVDKIVVKGVQVADLRKGPGYYPSTALVGNSGNTAIAGHRTTYGAPFNKIDELQPGDEIHITGILGRFTYEVMAPDVAFAEQLHTVEGQGPGHVLVRPGDTWVLGDFRDNRITLTACNPKFSARQRIIVAARLVDDVVELPEWADTAVAAALSGLDPLIAVGLGADEVAFGDPAQDGPDDDGTAHAETPAAGAPAAPHNNTTTFDKGLNGDRGAIPGAVAWMFGAITLWIVGGVIGRRLFSGRGRRLGARMAGLLPALVFLWFSFEMIDRALPAG